VKFIYYCTSVFNVSGITTYYLSNLIVSTNRQGFLILIENDRWQLFSWLVVVSVKNPFHRSFSTSSTLLTILIIQFLGLYEVKQRFVVCLKCQSIANCRFFGFTIVFWGPNVKNFYLTTIFNKKSQILKMKRMWMSVEKLFKFQMQNLYRV